MRFCNAAILPMHRPSAPSAVVRLFGLEIQAATLAGATALLAGRADLAPAAVVVTPNVDHLVRLDRQPDFQRRYAGADFIFADGMPVVWASRLLGRPLPERVTGSDLFVELCREAVQRSWRVTVLGGMPGSEAMLHERFQQAYPGIDVDLICPSMRFDPHGPEALDAVARIQARAPQVVFVCLGMPKQELWALQHASALPGGIILCVGAAMEFGLGLQRRAPRWVQRAGLEWLSRLLSDPRRFWRRYLVDDPHFLRLCWREWRRMRTAR